MQRTIAPLRAFTLVAATVFAGFAVLIAFGASKNDARATCIRGALSQPELRHGMAAFTTEQGDMATVATTPRSFLRLSAGSDINAASLTKPLVASQVERLVDSGMLGLDMPIETLLTDYEIADENAGRITIRNLLQHTAGFYSPDADPLWERDRSGTWIANCQHAARFVLRNRTNSPSGSATKYSNAGYCILGEVVRRHAAAGHLPDVGRRLRSALDHPLGGAGGWSGTIVELYESLLASLPISLLPEPDTLRADGTWYAYGWRNNPARSKTAQWSHFGHLDGLLTSAQTDGSGILLVAYFEGSPSDPAMAARRFDEQAWRCMH